MEFKTKLEIIRACVGFVYNLNLKNFKLYLKQHEHSELADKVTDKEMVDIMTMLSQLNNILYF